MEKKLYGKEDENKKKSKMSDFLRKNSLGIWKKFSFFLSSEEAPEPLVSPRGNRLEVSDVEKKLYPNENCFDTQCWVSPLVVNVLNALKLNIF